MVVGKHDRKAHGRNQVAARCGYVSPTDSEAVKATLAGIRRRERTASLSGER